MEDWIGLRAFAKRRRISHTAVQKAIRDGRVPDSAVRRNAGRIVAIEFHAATAAWHAHTDPAAAAKNGLGVPAANERPLPGAEEILTEESALATGAELFAVAARDPHGYQFERAKREKFTAATAELEYLKAIGRVVDVEESNEAQRSLFRNVRDKFLNLADRLTPVVTSERDPARVHASIKGEIEKVLNELSNDAQAAAAEGTPERVAA